jgi:hypothetical protein
MKLHTNFSFSLLKEVMRVLTMLCKQVVGEYFLKGRPDPSAPFDVLGAYISTLQVIDGTH